MEPVARVPAPGEAATAAQAADLAKRVFEGLSTVMHAPCETLRLPLLCLLAEGHVLVEDVPGVGKTVLAKGPCPHARLTLLTSPVHT